MLATHARFLWTGGVFPCQFVVARTMCIGIGFCPFWGPLPELGSLARIGLFWPELGSFGPNWAPSAQNGPFGPKWALCPKWAPWPVMGPRPEMGLPLPK